MKSLTYLDIVLAVEMLRGVNNAEARSLVDEYLDKD